ncbi:SSI family serine proteinase inhibitor [Actinokineospora inagensis]|uniref:SSI family serine proteinase inhibitor n=1 Tax=Actinokineospora inagensis TaxID=103730 RepID=UPI0003FF7200|nr:SSI family serine proteinase inhibitor [Actinokineospora inagensis]
MRTVFTGAALLGVVLGGSVLGGGALAATGVSGADSARPDGVGLATAPGASLTLTIHWDRAAGGQDKTAHLYCDPSDGSDHADPAAACAALTAVRGNLDALPRDESKICTYNYDPVTVTVKGTWRGTGIDFKRRYANQCEAIAESNQVFGF